jgi:hypothetical protein
MHDTLCGSSSKKQADRAEGNGEREECDIKEKGRWFGVIT